MKKIIQYIRDVIGEKRKLTFTIWDNEVWFTIYEVDIPINVDLKDKYVYMPCEVMDDEITMDMMKEITQVMMILEDNIEDLTESLEMM